jgi:outer membrane protein TolC
MSANVSKGDLSQNSNMRQLDIQEEMLKKSVEIQRAANLPSLALAVNYNYIAMSEDLKIKDYKFNPYSVAALSLNVPIFAGGKRRADLNSAKINLENLQLQRENLERQLNTAVVQYHSNMLTNIKQYYAADQTIVQAKRGYDIAVKRYEVGEGTLVEIDNSQVAYTQAELSKNTAIYNYLINKVGLDKIKGDYSGKN